MSNTSENLTARIKQIAGWVDVAEFYANDTSDEFDAYNATREVFLMLSAFAESIVVDELNAVTLDADPDDALVSLTRRRSERARRTPPESWRRWSTERLAKFIVDGLAKVLPPFWWRVDYDGALAAAARIIDDRRGGGVDIDGAPRVLDWETQEFVMTIGWEIVGSGEIRNWPTPPS